MQDLSHEVYFNGNVAQQCAAGTYPECREVLVGSLERKVELGHMSRDEMDSRIEEADEMWKNALKNADVKKAVAEREAMKVERAAAIQKAADNTLDAEGLSAPKKAAPKKSAPKPKKKK